MLPLNQRKTSGRPLISVIMPNFNGAKYLHGAIESFLQQDYSDKELVIVDAKSEDTSHKIIDSYCSLHKEIVWIQEQDRSISEAINIGIDNAEGEIIGYMGSDDLLLRGVLDEVAYASSWCDFDAVYFDSYNYYVYEKKCVLRKCPKIDFSRDNLLRFGTIVGLQDIFFRRRVYEKHRYDVNNKLCPDYEFYLRISKENYLYLYIEKVASANIQDGNISSDPSGKQFKEACAVAASYADGYRGALYYDAKRKRGLATWRRCFRYLKTLATPF